MSYELMDRVNMIPDLRPLERCVLNNLAWRANHKSNRCYPSVDRIAKDTSISARQVYRALHTLREKKLITPVGTKKHGTVIYLLTLWPPKSTVAACQPGVASMPHSHPNTGSEVGKGTVEMSPQVQLQKQPGKDNPITTSTLSHEESAPSVSLTSPPADASAIIEAWKTAHSHAGLPCDVTPKTASQLTMLAKAVDIPIAEAVEVLIPISVKEWGPMWQVVKGQLGKFLPLWKHLTPPPRPHAGFLLKFRSQARHYCSGSSEERAEMFQEYGLANSCTQSDAPLAFNEEEY